MKKITYLSLIGIITALNSIAQSPESFKYQAIARDANGNILANQQVELIISILQNDVNGAVVYTETHDSTSNMYGLVTLNIGIGNPTTFGAINWGAGPHYLKIEMNGMLMGISQLLSVPYALHAKTAESLAGGITETDPQFIAWDKSSGISITENQISDLNYFTNSDETDPIFNASVAGNIKNTDTTYWNNKLDSYTEIDPIYNISVAKGINALDTANWNNKLETEADPIYIASLASKITAADTINWNNKLSETPNLTSVLETSSDAGTSIITNMGFPTNLNDAVTKEYVDIIKEGILLDIATDDSIQDFDGNYYDVVIIGKQAWTAENLKTTHYADGTAIPFIENDAEWVNLGTTGQAYCFYSNDPTKYGGGALYSWAAAMKGASANNHNTIQGVCPDGWHLPTDDDWQELYDFVGGNAYMLKAVAAVCNYNFRGSDYYGLHIGPGGGMRSWYNGASTGGCNPSFWSSYQNDGSNAIMYRMWYNKHSIERAAFPKDSGNSVRCVKD